jgi:NAD(P)-dependent dehydrogenase (short-subunit alcohol dehydrogenase family)
MDLNLTGKAALVTGAISGVGYAIADRLAEHDADVAICGRTKLELSNSAALIGARGILLDMTTDDGARMLVDTNPDVDILINSLSICDNGDFWTTSDEKWRRLFEVNVLAGIRLSRMYIPRMQRRGWGRIIFIATFAGPSNEQCRAHDSMIVGALLGLSRGLAEACKGTGITVSVVVSGPSPLHPVGLTSREVDRLAELVIRASSPIFAPVSGDAIDVDTPLVFSGVGL